jgi:hypothetical protein
MTPLGPDPTTIQSNKVSIKLSILKSCQYQFLKVSEKLLRELPVVEDMCFLQAGSIDGSLAVFPVMPALEKAFYESGGRDSGMPGMHLHMVEANCNAGMPARVFFLHLKNR